MASTMDTRTVNGHELPPTGTYAFDTHHTNIGFVARHMLSKVRGRFAEYEGEVAIAEKPEDSSVRLEIKAASIDTDSQMRDDHLRSPDFLEVETYPTLSFTSSGFRIGDGNRFELDGDLTIRGITRPVTLHGEFLGTGPGLRGGTLAAFSASTTIDREDWDLTWNVAVETGGLLVGKKVEVEIDAELVLEDQG
jgi:polyisoprenoid-binding protein YceI